MKYALEALTPASNDSYFCWGFFDSFLQQKEWFSSYVFEDIAADILNKQFDDENKKDEQSNLIN